MARYRLENKNFSIERFRLKKLFFPYAKQNLREKISSLPYIIEIKNTTGITVTAQNTTEYGPAYCCIRTVYCHICAVSVIYDLFKLLVFKVVSIDNIQIYCYARI